MIQANLHVSNSKFYDVKFSVRITILLYKMCMVRVSTHTKCNKTKIKSDYGWHITMAVIIIWSCMLILRNHKNIFIIYDCCTFYACLSKCDVMLCICIRTCRNVEPKNAENLRLFACTQINTSYRIRSSKWFNDTKTIEHTIIRIMFSSCISGTTRCVPMCTLV